MPQHPDVLIVGGGVIGASCARALAFSGARVTVIEAGAQPAGARAGAAWVASAGMLAAQVEARPDDPLLPLALAGRAWFAEQDATFRGSIGSSDCGIVEVAHDDDNATALQARVSWQQQRGLRADWIEPGEVGARWSWFAPTLGAFFSPDDGAVDPRLLVATLRRDGVAAGARIVCDRVISLDCDASHLRGVIGEHGRYHAGAVVIAAGAWTPAIERMPRQLPVEPVRGQMMAFPWPAAGPSAIVYGEGCYLLQRGDELLVGATVEHVGFDASVTADGIADLHARAGKVYPALATMEPVRTWAGLRPGTRDGLPIIGAESRLPGLWYAAGHGRNGILLSGITGELIARGIAGVVNDATFSGSMSATLGD